MKACSKIVILSLFAMTSCASQIQKTAEKCFLPEDQKGLYGNAKAINRYSAKAVRGNAESKDGCASAKFQLDKNGKAINVKLLTEDPMGYDYGKALIESIKGSTYEQPMDTSHWYFIETASTYRH